MLRCVFAAFAAILIAAPAAAQLALQRSFPQHALRGEIVVVQPPDITLNGNAARLAPGARIRGGDNLLVLSAAVVGTPLRVHYTVDELGLVKDVWVLRDDEAARPWPKTPDEAARWAFDPVAQVWTRR